MCSHHLPGTIAAAVCLLVAAALLSAIPYKTLFNLSASLELRWYFSPNYPGWWVGPSLQVLLALFVLHGFAWSRYAVAALVLGLLLLQLNTSLGTQMGNFPLAKARDAVSAIFQLAALVLLFLPNANSWFTQRAVLK